MSDQSADVAPSDGFTRLLARRLNDEQRTHLFELRESLGIANNDALWKILVVLEEYDGLFKSYPEKLEAAAAGVFAAQKSALAVTVAAETSHVRRSLESALIKTVHATAGRQADAVRWRAWGWVAAALTLFAGVCVAAGASLAHAMDWNSSSATSLAARILVAILRAPAGWTLFVLLLPPAVTYALQGWTTARDASAPRAERLTGAATLAGAVTATVASGAILLRVLGAH